MTDEILKWVKRFLPPPITYGKNLLEVGSYDMNGTSELRENSIYWGVDIQPGPNVDEIKNIDHLWEYGMERFDIVVCLETLEHVKDWRRAINNLKWVLKREGLLLVSTPSIGYPYHKAPKDYWRFEREDWRKIFADMEILNYERTDVGWIVLARKLTNDLIDLSDIRLYSILTLTRRRRAGLFGNPIFHFFRNTKIVKGFIKTFDLDDFFKRDDHDLFTS